jgi:hypothetical protein
MDSQRALQGSPCTSPGLPGPVSSLSTRVLPTHPGQPDACVCSLLPRRLQASSSSEEWPLPVLASRGRIGFAVAGLACSLSPPGGGGRPAAALPQPDRSVSRRQLPFDAGPELHGERAIHMADTSQSAREKRVIPAQPKLAKIAEDERCGRRPLADAMTNERATHTSGIGVYGRLCE